MANEYREASARARKHADDAQESSDHHLRELAEMRGSAVDAAEKLEVAKSNSMRRKHED